MKNWIIHWDYQMGDSFLFGSEINLIAPDFVKYENKLLPPGTDLRIWKSKIDFQTNKRGNSLPVLTPEKEYWLKLNVKLKENESVYIKVEFYNRFNEFLEFKIIYGEGSFIYPKEAAYYNIILINNGVSSFVFQNIILSVDDYKESIPGYKVSEVLNHSEDSTELTIIFTEPMSKEITNLSNSNLINFKDVIIVKSSFIDSHLYLDSDFQEYLFNIINNLKNTFEINRIKFIGYGPISNFSAVYYSHYLKNSIAVITDEWFESENYTRIIKKYSLKNREGLNIQGNLEIDKSKIVMNNINNKIDNRFSKFIDRSNILKNMEVRD